MDETTDYQTNAIYGNAPNYSAIDATTLNPNASSPSDWTTVLTNGIAQTLVNGIGGVVNNQVQQGQIQNAIAAKNGGVLSTGRGSPGGGMGLLLIAALVYVALK